MHKLALHTIENVLDELEVLAHSSANESEFLKSALHRLQDSSGANAVLLVVQSENRHWMLRGGCGAITEEVHSQILESFSHHGDQAPVELSADYVSKGAWYAFAISNRWGSLGHVVFVFSESLTESAKRGLQELVAAFSEVLTVRRADTLAEFFQSDWKLAQRSLTKLSSATTIDQCYALLVNELATIFAGSRVSVCEHKHSRCVVRAISAVNAIDLKSTIVDSLMTIANGVVHQGKSQVRSAHGLDLPKAKGQTSEGLFPYYAFIPIAAKEADQTRWVIGFEYLDSDALAAALVKLPELLPAFGIVLDQRVRWLSVPETIRELTTRSSWHKVASRPLAKYSLVIVAILAATFFMLRPQAMIIDAEGMLTPSEVKTIFSSADGYLEELLVAENEQVQANQVLLRMRSPALELQIEELQGQLRSLEEESHGLEISINQSKSSASDQLNEQSTIASKLSDIKIQRESISEQLNILKAQYAELEIRSPIQGVVAGRELRQNLQGRPVARGDALFKVINLESPWEIRIRVADRDSGYVSKAFGNTKNRNKLCIQFVLDGLPSQTHRAEVASIANQVENIHAEGTFVTVVAKVLEPKANMRVGSNVHAYFECGSEPTWFVWTRPLIESLQRRMWL